MHGVEHARAQRLFAVLLQRAHLLQRRQQGGALVPEAASRVTCGLLQRLRRGGRGAAPGDAGRALDDAVAEECSDGHEGHVLGVEANLQHIVTIRL